MNIKLILFTGLIAASLAFVANAGSIDDTDTDLIPDVFDNCSLVANGPAGQDQLDADADGFGNICDGDLDQDGVVAGSDFAAFVALFGAAGSAADFDGDGVVAGSDFAAFVALFGSAPGPGATAI
ncbi:MAG: thrombospondin type 3 repeat-containing protein [Myxococcales bacterium]|nr:hypothetical protein [Myxococcales bacterium]HIL81368.1 hypothetical protein [Myxococcales bacterium]